MDREARLVHWDESKAVSLCATAAQVKANRQEVMLLFGSHVRSDHGEARASIDERIVLSPFVAKRLLALLNNVIEQYESAYGKLDSQREPEAKDRAKDLLPLPPFRFRPTVEKFTSFFKLVSDLRLRFALERSFKLSDNTLLAGRFLVGIKKAIMDPDGDAKMLLLAEAIGMPTKLFDDLRTNLARANVVGFGFGENEDACIVRTYLEFENPVLSPRRERNGVVPYVCNLGFKWDAADDSNCAVTTYLRFPGLTVKEIQERIAQFHTHHSETVDVVRDIIGFASTRAKGKTLFYTEVKEEGSSRLSFDINMYNANLPMRNLRPFLGKICTLYSVPRYDFDRVYESVTGQVFGHLAGGTGRNGEDFITVYFGD